MDDLILLLGYILVLFGPLLLIPITWLIYRFGVSPYLMPRLARYLDGWNETLAGTIISLFFVLSILAASYLPGRMEFNRLCSNHGRPEIQDRVSVEGYLGTRVFPYQASSILRDSPFRYIETRDPYNDEQYLIYRLDADGALTDSVIEKPASRFGVKNSLSRTAWGNTLNKKTIYELKTGRVLAGAASITFDGGPLSLLLGVYAMEHCPDIISETGSERFNTFYNLESKILGGD